MLQYHQAGIAMMGDDLDEDESCSVLALARCPSGCRSEKHHRECVCHHHSDHDKVDVSPIHPDTDDFRGAQSAIPPRSELPCLRAAAQ